MRKGRSKLLSEIKSCTICRHALPNEPNPITSFTRSSRVILIGQAPGRKAHESGIPWNDASGVRLRDWLGVTPDQFYDPSLFALVPMGFCYPGTGKSGDLAPRPECAATWMAKIRKYLRNIDLEIIIGKYASDYRFGRTSGLEKLIREHSGDGERFVLPHPSPRNNIWLAKNPWFVESVLPKLKKRIKKIIC